MTAEDWHRRRYSIDSKQSATIVKQEIENFSTDRQLVRVLPSTWDTVGARFRMRSIGGDYFFEVSENDGDVATKRGNRPPISHSQQTGDTYDYYEEIESFGSRRALWEPIINGGKQGVFITYAHAVVMLLIVAACGILLAWGCYSKGLSASLAQSAIKTLDQSQFFTSHVHRLIIQRPGEEDMTISSVISRSLVINTLGGNSQVPLLENGDVARSGASAKGVAATEAMLMERFSRAAANESAAILLSGRYVSRKQKLLMDDLYMDGGVSIAAPAYSATQLTDTINEDVSMGSPAAPVLSKGSILTGSRKSPLFAEEDRVSKEDDDDSDICKVLLSAVDEDVDVEFLAIDHVLQNNCFEPTGLKKDTFYAGTDSARVMSGPKSISSSGEVTTGSCCSNSDSDSSHQSSGGGDARCMRGNQTGMDEKLSADKSSVRGSSQSSSCNSEAPSNEAEVLFPFVCQSRFVNEFEELSAIGKGGFGQVTLAENRLDGRKYAIKRVGLNLKNQTSKTLQKFLREVKILALLDHANIVRYYQAWLEKVGESTNGTSVASSVASDTSSVGGLAAAANYSTNNLLAPISELEFPGDQRNLESFYSNRSVISDNADDGGFVWERETSSMEGEDGWKEEDLVVQNKPRMNHLPPRVSSSCAPAAHGSDEDSSCNAVEKCDHWLYIQMQYCAGRNLADYLAVPSRPMELSRMLKIFVQIASALAHVHSCGLIHRDLKPANIFVADVERDEIKLGDFGLSRYAANASSLNASASLDDPQQGHLSNGVRDTPLSTSVWSNMSESTEVTAGVGTYLYASPEQVAGKKYNAKTDMYSLGMILFELCHDRFGTTMERYITLRDARDSKFPADLRAAKRCPEILDMLSKLLSHDPSARPTADAVVQWGQMMYETSLAQKAMDVVRSPRNLGMIRAATGASFFVPGIDHFMAGIVETVATTTFCLKVEAAMEHCSGETGGERRLPNHNLLKQICDVIAGVHNGKVEIKKCGLHMENEGVTILEFELDPQSALAVAPGSDVEGSVVLAIEALAGVQTVHRVSKID